MYICEPSINSLSQNEKDKLAKLFYAICEIRCQYIFPLDEENMKKYDEKFLKIQKDARKNVDEAILKAIQKNPNILFIKLSNENDGFQPLWKYLVGTERDTTLLPKTMEYIMKYPKAPLVEDSRGIILPYAVAGYEPYIINLATEIPECRTWQLLSTGKNIAIYLVSNVIGDYKYQTVNNPLVGDLGIEIIDKFLNYKDCSIQQDLCGDNIGTACILRARKLLDMYYERKKTETTFNEKYNIYLELAKKLQKLALKSMTLYPETAEQSRWNGDALSKLYTYLCNDFANKTSYFDEKKKQIEIEQQEKENTLNALIPTPEVLAKKLSIK